MPSPPCRAIAIAMRDSVTVSIALESSGTLRVSSRVSLVPGVDLTRYDVGLSRQQEDVVIGQPEGSELLGHTGRREIHVPIVRKHPRDLGAAVAACSAQLHASWGR